MAGILYLCATPIGNLEDMTPRAQRMLAEADSIAAEDTRHTLQLLNRFNIKGRLVRYDEHSKERQGAYLLDELLSGKNIALVSDAGFPGIADPGEQLASAVFLSTPRASSSCTCASGSFASCAGCGCSRPLAMTRQNSPRGLFSCSQVRH